MSEAACTECDRLRLNSKAAGHQNWRRFVCWDHAAFNLDSPEGRALFADLDGLDPIQRELFARSEAA